MLGALQLLDAALGPQLLDLAVRHTGPLQQIACIGLIRGPHVVRLRVPGRPREHRCRLLESALFRMDGVDERATRS